MASTRLYKIPISSTRLDLPRIFQQKKIAMCGGPFTPDVCMH